MRESMVIAIGRYWSIDEDDAERLFRNMEGVASQCGYPDRGRPGYSQQPDGSWEPNGRGYGAHAALEWWQE